MTLSIATLDEGAALLAASQASQPTVISSCTEADAAYGQWLWENSPDLIAAARQAQDNAKDAERYRYFKQWRSGACGTDEIDAWEATVDAAITAATPPK